MEKRLVLAVVLMVAVMVFSNLLFPPVPTSPGPEAPTDTTAARTPVEAGESATEPEGAPAAAPEPPPQEPPAVEREPPAVDQAALSEADTVVVRSSLFEYRFSTRGATLIGVRLLQYRSYAEGASEEERVQLVRPGDELLGYQIAIGENTLDLRDRIFEPSAGTVDLTGTATTDSVVFRHQWPGTEIVFSVTYRFRPDSYLVEVQGGLEGIGDRGYTVTTALGRGLETHEADPSEDLGKMAYGVLDREGDVKTENLSDVEPGEVRVVEGAPFRWVGSKSKYFLAALVSHAPNPGFGGLIVEGVEEENAARMAASLPVPAGEAGFTVDAFFGPQDYGRLKAVGEDLQNVNPFGWRWLQPVIRPLAGLIIAILVWMHGAFNMAYGWVLIVFGVLSRVVLFPLYQKSMRAQMSQMQVQPLIKELQEKYKDEPQKMQQEMMRLYKEHNINPLAGCLPMLLPFPILITLFFVFQNTIEFRGVPFLWLPDLSLKDPIYVVPLLMGASMLLLNWIGQRGMQSNTQMKVMGYAMPVLFTFLFANFPSGLNLYYATSNIASLPQQMYLAKEKRKAREKAPRAGGDEDGSRKARK